MTRHTSHVAYNAIVEGGLLPVRRLEVYSYIYRCGPCTAMQVERGLRTKHANKRTSELREQGVLMEVGEVRCPVTGELAILWEVTDALPRKLEREIVGKTRKQLEEENRRLLVRVEAAERAMRALLWLINTRWCMESSFAALSALAAYVAVSKDVKRR